jgi:RecB family endonuclease NucS
MVGKLDPVELREVWSKEAKDFTTWLLNNGDILSEQIGVELTVLEREKSVGTFSVDLMGEDKNGHPVIIETA